jgi:hypothetical protein
MLRCSPDREFHRDTNILAKMIGIRLGSPLPIAGTPEPDAVPRRQFAKRRTKTGRRSKSAERSRGFKWRAPALGAGRLSHRFEIVPSDTQTFRILREVLG